MVTLGYFPPKKVYLPVKTSAVSNSFFFFLTVLYLVLSIILEIAANLPTAAVIKPPCKMLRTLSNIIFLALISFKHTYHNLHVGQKNADSVSSYISTLEKASMGKIVLFSLFTNDT